MQVSFFNDYRRNHYVLLSRDLSPKQLIHYFHLNDRDQRLIKSYRGQHNRLGFAIRLCSARFHGTLLDDLSSVPDGVIRSPPRAPDCAAQLLFQHRESKDSLWLIPS